MNEITSILQELGKHYVNSECKIMHGQTAYLIHSGFYCADGDEVCIYLTMDGRFTDFGWLTGKIAEWGYDCPKRNAIIEKAKNWTKGMELLYGAFYVAVDKENAVQILNEISLGLWLSLLYPDVNLKIKKKSGLQVYHRQLHSLESLMKQAETKKAETN